MELLRIGRQTFRPAAAPVITGFGSAAGSKEQAGPLAGRFDHTSADDRFGQKSWEKAESAMQELALDRALQRAGLHSADLDLLLAGDLLNQCIGSSFAAREQGVPFLGLYGACSTMGESLGLAALLVGAGYGRRAAAVTSSHFCSAERQYRTPLEYGCQRPPTAQWTATAAGAVVLEAGKALRGPTVTAVTVGRVQDKGVTDANNMGAAMAPVSVKLTPCAAHIGMRHDSTHKASTGRGYPHSIVSGGHTFFSAQVMCSCPRRMNPPDAAAILHQGDLPASVCSVQSHNGLTGAGKPSLCAPGVFPQSSPGGWCSSPRGMSGAVR